MADPNRFRSDGPKVNNTHGKLYEPRVAKKLSARLTPNSGAMTGAKGDATRVADRKWLLEMKTTVNATLPMDLGWLVKISEEAYAKGMEPALVFSFVLPDGRPRPNATTEWVAIPLAVYQELTEKK